MGVSEGALGLGLIGAACGALFSLSFAGRLIEQVGHRFTMPALLPLLPLFYALAAHANGALTLFISTPAIWALVLFTIAGMVLEGAGIDWSAIYMRDVVAATPFISGLAVATGALTQG